LIFSRLMPSRSIVSKTRLRDCSTWRGRVDLLRMRGFAELSSLRLCMELNVVPWPVGTFALLIDICTGERSWRKNKQESVQVPNWRI
jgi:hypothetical protein